MALAVSVAWLDVGALVLLGMFAVWGARHGAVRQGLGLVVVAAGLALAGPVGPRVEGIVARIVTLSPAGTACAAWGVVLLVVLVAGGVLLHLAHAALDRARLGRFDRWTGALLGLVKGAVVLTLAAYVLLGASLPRPGPPEDDPVRTSATVRGARSIERRIDPMLRLSPLVRSRVDEVDAAIGSNGSAASP